jgi:hypothetical protein
MMRTTLQLDDDVLVAARVLARERGLSIGAVISDLVRQALKPPTVPSVGVQRSGLRLLPVKPSGGGVIDLALVNQLRDEES